MTVRMGLVTLLVITAGCVPEAPGTVPGTTPAPGAPGRPLTPLEPLRVHDGDALVTSEDDAEALAGVAVITGDLVVEATDLRALELPELVRVDGAVRIWENEALTELDLGALVEVGAELSLYDDPLLTDLSGLSSLQWVGGALSVNRMVGLTDLRGLEALEEIGGDLYVFHSIGLVTLDGLDALARVGVGIQLWELYALEEVHLPALTWVEGKLDLFECDRLERLEAPALTTLRAYELHTCDAMVDLGSFPLVTRMEGALTVQYNPAVRSLAGFPALREIGQVTVRHNPELLAMDLDATQEIGVLVALDNAALAVPGPPDLQQVDGLLVANNPVLSTCAVEAWLDGIPGLGLVQCEGNLDDGCHARCL